MDTTIQNTEELQPKIEYEYFEEDGIKYQTEIHPDGTRITTQYHEPNEVIEVVEEVVEEEPLTETEQIMMALTDLYEQNEKLQADNENIMLALADIYEGETPSE